MNFIRLYVDEDAMRGKVVFGLQSRKVDVIRASDAAMVQREDEDHLMTATGLGRVLYSYNTGDYQLLHQQWLAVGRNHSGIVVAKQQRYSIGEELRRLTRLMGALTAEEMRNRMEYLGNWR